MRSEAVVLKVDGLKIAGKLYLPGNQLEYPAVCICHGIPAGKPDPKDKGYPLLAERICRHGFAVLLLNFRGTGASDGNLDILGWANDLKAAIDYLSALPEVDKSRLSLLGFSGGAAVSIYVASQDSRVSSVAACACPAEFTMLTKSKDPSPLINHFRSIGVIRDYDFPHSAEEWLDGFRRISPIRYIEGIAPRPLLLVHGSRDEVVEVSHVYRLYDRAGEPKKLTIIEGAGHRLRHNEKAMAIVIEWLKSQTKSSSQATTN